MRKSITKQDQWGQVIPELQSEYYKLQTYDHTILQRLGDIGNLKILDYGSGPGVMAMMLTRLGAIVKVYDISKEMREIAEEKLGRTAVFNSPENIPDKYFDVVLCNLVVCIISEEEMRSLLKIVGQKVNEQGKVYIGFCNPEIYNVKESKLDYRFPEAKAYTENHDYKKIKKEGNYEIIEKHRPIAWYKEQFKKLDFRVAETLFTPEYELDGFKIKDFIIFELTKE